MKVRLFEAILLAWREIHGRRSPKTNTSGSARKPLPGDTLVSERKPDGSARRSGIDLHDQLGSGGHGRAGPQGDPECAGNRLTPSVVAFTDRRDPGRRAATSASQTPNARSTRSSVSWDGAQQVKSEEAIVPYEIVGRPRLREGPRGRPRVRLRKSPPWSAVAEGVGRGHLGHKVEGGNHRPRAGDAQRQATKTPARWRGLEVTDHQRAAASSLAYGLDKKATEKIVVFDLGGTLTSRCWKWPKACSA